MRRNELIVQLILNGAFFLCVFIALILFPFIVNAPIKSVLIMSLFWIAGFAMLFKAKLSVFKKGKLVSFGPGDMSEENRISYILGYVLMGVGLIFSLGIIVVCR